MINQEPIDGGVQQPQLQQPQFTIAYAQNVTSKYCVVCMHAKTKSIRLFVHPPDLGNAANAHPHTGTGIATTYYPQPTPHGFHPMSYHPWSTPPPGYNGVPYVATQSNELVACISQLSMYPMNGTTSPMVVHRFNESPITIATPHHHVDVRQARPVAPIDKWMPSLAPAPTYVPVTTIGGYEPMASTQWQHSMCGSPALAFTQQMYSLVPTQPSHFHHAPPPPPPADVYEDDVYEPPPTQHFIPIQVQAIPIVDQQVHNPQTSPVPKCAPPVADEDVDKVIKPQPQNIDKTDDATNVKVDAVVEHEQPQQNESIKSEPELKPSPPPQKPLVPTRTLDELRKETNPKQMRLPVKQARFFVIKSFSEDDVHRSVKYGVWCSTEHGNKRLNSAYEQQQKCGGHVYLFYSVNASGQFCGVAEMTSSVDYARQASVWVGDAKTKWQGLFAVRWHYVKDVPNFHLRHIRNEWNENKPVTNSRDTQEMPSAVGQQLLTAIHAYAYKTCLFDDFDHYDDAQKEECDEKTVRVEGFVHDSRHLQPAKPATNRPRNAP